MTTASTLVTYQLEDGTRGSTIMPYTRDEAIAHVARQLAADGEAWRWISYTPRSRPNVDTGGKGPHTWCDACGGTHTDAPCDPEEPDGRNP